MYFVGNVINKKFKYYFQFYKLITLPLIGFEF